MKSGLAETLLKYINPLFLLSTISITNDTTRNPVCYLEEMYIPDSYVMEGDAIIGGVLKVSDSATMYGLHFNRAPSESTCEFPMLYYLRHLLAFIFAIQEINSRGDILPNITLGYILYDSCEAERRALQNTLCVISGREIMTPNYNCYQKGQLVGIVGHQQSSLSVSMASVTRIYKYPQLSYGSRDTVFNDEIKSSSFHHTFPSQRAQQDALVQLLKHFGWTWVGIISSSDESSQHSSVELKKKLEQNGICVEFQYTHKMHYSLFMKESFTSKLAVERSTCHVVIFNCEFDDTFLLSDISTKMDLRKVFIFLFNFPTNLNVDQMLELNGSLILTLHRTGIPGLKKFLLDAHLQKYPDLLALRKIWVNTFNCLPYGFVPNTLKEYIATVCNESNNFHKLKSEAYDVDNFRLTFHVYGAVYALAHALHDLTSNRIQNHSLDSLPKWKLNYYLKKIHVLTPGKEEIYFNRDGHFLSKFDVLNFIVLENKSTQTNTVGYYRETNDGFQSQINNSAIRWNPIFFQPPESTCSKSCLLGYQRIPMKGQHKCCYSCLTCPEGQISNATDMEKCMTCPEDKFSNQERTACIPRATEFLSHGDALGISLIVISLVFCFLTAVILGIFVKYKDTAIVKANNRNLSFILLLSLMLSFLCPLLFIGRPSKLSCLLRQVAFGNIFTVAVSSVLAKTVTVVLAFRATKPDRTIRKWLWKNLTTYLLLVSSFGEIVICIFWLINSPPFPEHNTQVAFDKIILQCNEGSSIAFYIVFVYIGFLAMFSFIVAFLARKLPDTFNEAQYITFSMLVFCSAWISFIPAYLSTKGKYMVAVEVFAILSSSAGLLGCIFIPKCYIILMRPELNIKSKIIFVVK